MNEEEIKFDHFKNIDELLKHIDIWYKENDIDYTRWFHLEDLKKVKDYITNLQQENKQLKERIDKVKEYITTEQLYTDYQWGKSQYTKILKDLLELLGDKENE